MSIRALPAVHVNVVSCVDPEAADVAGWRLLSEWLLVLSVLCVSHASFVKTAPAHSFISVFLTEMGCGQTTGLSSVPPPPAAVES